MAGQSDFLVTGDVFPKNGAQIRDVPLGSRLEAALFEGVKFNISASTVPCAYDQDKASEKIGNLFMGYVNARGEDYTDFLHEAAFTGQVKKTSLGGFRVYDGALYGFRELKPVKPEPKNDAH